MDKSRFAAVPNNNSCQRETKSQQSPKNLRIMQATNLCVPSTDIKHGGVVGFGDESAHLNVPNTVVDTEEWLPPKLCNCTSHQSHRHQGGTHTWTLREEEEKQREGLLVTLWKKNK